jgi:hypothetical protein
LFEDICPIKFTRGQNFIVSLHSAHDPILCKLPAHAENNEGIGIGIKYSFLKMLKPCRMK